MNDLHSLLRDHYNAHPNMEIQDAVKFLYQSFMGPGHLISDEGAARDRLRAEWENAAPNSEVPLIESLGDSYIRLNISACKAIGLSIDTTAKLFLLSAQTPAATGNELRAALSLVYELPFPRERVDEYLEHYRAADLPAVSHSETYRAGYTPAYRVISRRFEHTLPILAAIDRQLRLGVPVRVAIDGPCASGKSTLGEQLREIYDCPLIHMDDFFLQPHQRTAERLSQPGGNVDYERFSEEVLTSLVQNQTARYRPWQCGTADFGNECVIPPSPLVIVEGSYSMRLDLRDNYTLRIWVEAPWPLREQRLLERGGPDCLQCFQELWIPLEDRYFQSCAVRDCCHLSHPGY